jgi:superfamily II DNA or RNA helicase
VVSPPPGSFEYLEAKIRRDATGTLFGRDFEWVCQWYLEHAPLYRGKFRRVWRWAEWPDRWGPDCGIDLVAETHEGKLWAIQAKAVGAAHSITKAEIDSFLAESNRRQIAFRLLIGTTDNIGSKARRTIDEQAKHASVVLRGDLVAADLSWPTRVGGVARKPIRAKPRPHQRKAISAVLRGFRKHKRGRLIMACGTGKTLTGLWIHERLTSRWTLLLVPSISLVQQNLREWGRHAREDFDFLVVCSDESVVSDRDDPALRYIAELGIDVTTDAKDIAAFLAKRRHRPAVVIATYQSSDRVSAGQRKAQKSFDLALCDEAHRLVGDMRGKFATVLDDRKIRCRRRLFMTATPRYFTQRARKRAADQDLEVASMDDPKTFGPEFHVLKFFDAITAKPTPLLTDYRVVVIGVTNAEAARWVAQGKLVRTSEGAETDARTLAAQIGLAKAMREYDLRRVITFHRSIRRASRFVDAERPDSLPAIVETLRPTSRPSGKLWARHISGETPASKRASMLRALAELPAGTRGLIANCACLGEGVDVPALDGIAFIDPKGSMVDIIQAVGRVIRLSKDKAIGTIVIPVFIDDTADAGNALAQSAFEPVWQVLKALRAHDARLADEFDAMRTNVGKQRSSRVTLPDNVILHLPRLAISDFEQAFYVRAVERVSERPPLTIQQILEWADEHKAKTGRWPSAVSGKVGVTNEVWILVDQALRLGSRGLPAGSSVAQLLAAFRGTRNRKALPILTFDQILRWADEHHRRLREWPSNSDGAIDSTDETWRNVAAAMRIGGRGLPYAITLADLLARERGVPNIHNLPQLSVPIILEWADRYHAKHGDWPKVKSGTIDGRSESWASVDNYLRKGARSLPGGSSLAKLLADKRGVPNRKGKPRLTTKQILKWADAYKNRTGRFPTNQSGQIPGTEETWMGISMALTKGLRGLPGGSSLATLLMRHGRKQRWMPSGTG